MADNTLITAGFLPLIDVSILAAAREIGFADAEGIESVAMEGAEGTSGNDGNANCYPLVSCYIPSGFLT